MLGGGLGRAEGGMARPERAVATCAVHDARDSAEAVGIVVFSLDGRSYECRLCDAHEAELRGLMELWISQARPTSPCPPSRSGGSVPQRRAAAAGPNGGGGPAHPQGSPTRAGAASELGSRRHRTHPGDPQESPQRRARSGSRRRGPVQPRAKERYERVLEAASQVFAEVGIELANTNLIAQRAGTSIGSVYSLLGSKDVIASVLFERYQSALNAALDKVVIEADGPDTVIGSLVHVVHRVVIDEPGLLPLLRSRRPGALEVATGALRASLIGPLDRLIGLRRPSSDPARRHTVATMCAGILFGVVAETADRPEDEQAAALAELQLVISAYVTATASRS